MSSRIEYAIAFDTDTQQDVVLVRRNTSQEYQKYVFDEKLDRFERLPEEKKEDKSEKSTPQFLPLPPQDNSPLSRLLTRLTDPASDSITIKLDNALEMVKELQVRLESVNRSSSPDVAEKYSEEPADYSDEEACSDDSFSTAPELEKSSSSGSDDFELLTASGKDQEVESTAPAAPGPQDIKSGSSDLKNDHQQSSTAAVNYASPVAATKTQETGTTVYHLLAARNLKKNSAIFARKHLRVVLEGSEDDGDQESTRTALEPSDFDSEDSEVEDESYDEFEYSDEEEEESESDGDESMDQESPDIASRAQDKVQKPGEPASDSCQEQEQEGDAQEPAVAKSGLKNHNQELEKPASGQQKGEEPGKVKESRSDQSTAASNTPAAVPKPIDDESDESEYPDEEEDESDDESDYSDEEEEESDSDEEHEHSGGGQKPSVTASGPEDTKFCSADLKKNPQDKTTTAPNDPAASIHDQMVKFCSSDLKNSHQDLTATASNSLPPAATTADKEVNIEASSSTRALDNDQRSTTTAIEPSELGSEESDGEDESEYDSEYSDENEEEYSDEEDEEESENDASMDQEPSASIQHSENIAAETVTATGPKDIGYQVPPKTASEPAMSITVADGQEISIKTSRFESKPLVATTDAPETGMLTPSLTGASPPGQQEVMTTTSSTSAVPEPSDHESDESEVEDESEYDSEYSDEEEYESDDDSDYSDEEEEESDGLEEQEQPGVAQKSTETASRPEDTKPGSSDPKNDHQVPEATVSGLVPPVAAPNGQKIKVEASSHSKGELDDQISVKTALEPSECDSDVSDVEYASEYDSDCSDEDEEESDSDGEQEQPAGTANGPEDTKTCSFDFKNGHQEAKVAATKNQETGTTVYHLLAARNLAQNAAMLGLKYSGGVLKGSDAESTTTALEPSDLDSEDSEVEDESYDDSEYSDEEEEESGSDDDEPMGQGQLGDGQEPSGAQEKDQKRGEPASGSQEGSGSGPAASSGKQESESKGPTTSGDNIDSSDSDSEVSAEDSEYSDEEEEYSDEEEEEESENDAPMDQEPSANVRHSEKSAADVQGSGISMGSEPSTTVTPNLPKTVLSNDIFPICLQQCPAYRQFILHALNLLTQEIGAYILAKDGNLEEVKTPLKLNFRNYSEFKKGDWVIGNGEVNYELDANSRLQKFEYSEERKTFVKCEHGVVKMLAEKEVNAPSPKMEVLRGTEAVAKTDSRDSKVNDEESDSEIEDESDGSEETGDDMEDEEVSDEEDPFVYNPGARQEEPAQGDPDESIPTARPIRFRAPFLQAVNLNDTANMSDIPLTSPDESFAETSGDDSQYCVMTNDDVLLTKHQKDPNQACCIS